MGQPFSNKINAKAKNFKLIFSRPICSKDHYEKVMSYIKLATKNGHQIGQFIYNSTVKVKI